MTDFLLCCWILAELLAVKLAGAVALAAGAWLVLARREGRESRGWVFAPRLVGYFWLGESVRMAYPHVIDHREHSKMGI